MKASAAKRLAQAALERHYARLAHTPYQGKPRLKVSFSGGKTSAYMAHLIKTHLSDQYETVFIMANTSRERGETLEFADRCDRAWGLNLVYVEAVINPVFGEGTTHRVVTFDTAARNGEVFAEMIKVYGIPNMDFEPCNRELKLNAMKSYMRSIGWTDYQTAIGIRMDESRRVNPAAAAANKVIYPLIDLWPRDLQDVETFWEDQPFTLELQPHEGNCKGCFKKSDKKLFRSVLERPQDFDWHREMEAKYGWHGAPTYGQVVEGRKPRVFFRNYRSTDQLIAQARELGYVPAIPLREVRSEAARQSTFDFDAGGCSESCEPFAMEMTA